MHLLERFRRKQSGSIAKDRLKLLLVSDRANCSPETMELIKNEMINVISKYMDIDKEHIEIQMNSVDNLNQLPSLFANIPIKEVKTNNDKKCY